MTENSTEFLFCLVKMPGSCEVCSSEPSKYRCPTCELMRYDPPSDVMILHGGRAKTCLGTAVRLPVPNPTRSTVLPSPRPRTENRASHRPILTSSSMALAHRIRRVHWKTRQIHHALPSSPRYQSSRSFFSTTPDSAISCMKSTDQHKKRNGSSGTAHIPEDVQMDGEERDRLVVVEGHGQWRKGSTADWVESGN